MSIKGEGPPSLAGGPVEPDEQRRVAAHEAGHAVLIDYLEDPSKIEDIKVAVKLGDNGYYGVNDIKPRYALLTVDDIMRDVAVSMAGRAADVIVNGAPTNGAGGDLRNINAALWAMHLRSGLGGSFVVRERSEAPKEMFDQIEQEIRAANNCAEAVVRANEGVVRELADKVMQQRVGGTSSGSPRFSHEPSWRGDAHVLSGDEVRKYFKEHPLVDPPADLRATLPAYCAPKKK